MRTLVSPIFATGDSRPRDPESLVAAHGCSLGAQGGIPPVHSCHSWALGSRQQETDNKPLIIQAAAFLLSREQTLLNKK